MFYELLWLGWILNLCTVFAVVIVKWIKSEPFTPLEFASLIALLAFSWMPFFVFVAILLIPPSKPGDTL